MSPILGSLGAVAVKGFRALGTAFSNFIDNFNRTTSGSLGTPSGGTGTWLATKGTWNANGTKATSANAASTYPLASVEMGNANITINLDVDSTNSNGSGAAFWVSDAANWWGVFPWQATSVTYSQACSTYGQSGPSYVCNVYGQSGATYFCSTYGQAGPNYFCNAQTTNYFAYCSFGQVTNYTQVCNAYTSLFQCTTYSMAYDGFRGFYYSVCNAYANVQNCTTYGSAVSGYSCSGGAYSQGSWSYCTTQGGPFYSQVCNVQSGPFYSQVCNVSGGPFYSQICNVYFSQTNNNPGTKYLRLIKSVANTVTTVVDQTIAATAASIKVIVSNGTITGRAYTGTGQTTQTGSDLTNTPASPTTGTKHGILLAPGGFSQGNTVDNLSILLP